MTGKAKRFLRAMASTLPAIVMIGKNGLEPSVVASAKEAIEARELIKVKILPNAMIDEKSTFEALAVHLDAELVQIIGKNGVYYKAKKEPRIILPA